jgi:hypothetical protein
MYPEKQLSHAETDAREALFSKSEGTERLRQRLKALFKFHGELLDEYFEAILHSKREEAEKIRRDIKNIDADIKRMIDELIDSEATPRENGEG